MIVNSHRDLISDIFDKMDRFFRGKNGVNRASYSSDEEKAHKLVQKFAVELGLRTSEDYAGNTYFLLPDHEYDSNIIVTGSHLDSQPNAGNYDGLAGVISGIIALSCLHNLGVKNNTHPVVMAFRGEEASGWFKGYHRGHIGSRAALGTLENRELDESVHVLDGRPLRSHLVDLGINPEKMIKPSILYDLNSIRGFIELHIEQGPVLLSKDLPVGIVTGIRGNFRARSAQCIGEYSHSGGVPTDFRSDAVIATAKFVVELDKIREEYVKKGRDMVYATGKCYTNSDIHALSKVPGEVFFTIDVRSLDTNVLSSMEKKVQRVGDNISAQNNVVFNFGKFASTKPAIMNPEIIDELRRGCNTMGIPYIELPSGGGHDAVEFNHVDIPVRLCLL